MAVGGGENNFVDVYDVTGGATTWEFSIADRQTFDIEILAGSFTYDGTSYGTNLGGTLDGTVELKEGLDGTNFDDFANATTLTLDAAQKMGGWKKDNANTSNVQVVFTPVGLTSGTIRVLINIKNK